MNEARFVVHRTSEVIHSEHDLNSIAADKAAQYVVESKVENSENITKEATPLTDEEIEMSDDEEPAGDSKFDLYEEEFHTRPPMANIFNKLAQYTGGIEPTSGETKKLKEKSSNKLGTILGVYFPCLQNIFGVLFFLRLVWIIGVSGTALGFVIVFVCCCSTMLTVLSMSAIATNGKVPAGGSYFMISRSLGPEFGGTVGILFYFGTTVAAAMYIIGAIEVMLKYIVPNASLFGPIELDERIMFNNTRVYGVILLCIMMSCVFIGIKFVSKFSTISLACVLCSILCVYIGIFVANPSRSPKVCMLGDRLLNRTAVLDKEANNTFRCTKDINGPLYKLYCRNGTKDLDDEACKYFKENNVTEFPAIPGFYKPLLKDGFFQNYYTTKGSLYGEPGKEPHLDKGQSPSVSDIYISFTILIGIFFPSVTGIMAGSNRSGDLANPQFSIPLGSIAACATTSFVYLSAVIFFSATIEHTVLRDKFGGSVGEGLIVAKLAWPNEWVILIGSFLSTVGAGLQSLTGAPRLLQAIAQDNVIPFLEVFKVTTKRGEPLRAQALTFLISFFGVLIASIDSIAPLITMFFLMCYGFVNLATALNGFLQEPSWRPRFKYYHWTTSLLGLILCIALMFVSSWYYALVAIALAGGIYKYIEYRGATKEWGDATRGFQMSAAKKAILQLGDKPVHTKNWRPQILILINLDETCTKISHPKLVDFCSQLKAGRGLTIVGTVIEGELGEKKSDSIIAKETLNRAIRDKQIKGLSEIVVASNVIEAIKILCQTSGLGNLRHNCVMLSFPEEWANDKSHIKWKQFMATLRVCQASDLAVLVPKGIDHFPYRKTKKQSSNLPNDGPIEMTGTVDMWCIVHDGGLLLLLAHLLIRARAWCKCELRVFVVASEKDNTITLKKEVIQFVYDLRINAQVEVVELDQADISAYAFQRTMDLNMRKKILEDMNLRTVDTKREFQAILDKHHVAAGELTMMTNVNDISPDLPFSTLPTINVDVHENEPTEKFEETVLEEDNNPNENKEPINSQISQLKSSNTEQTLILTPDSTPLQNQRSVTFAAPTLDLSNARGDMAPEKINEFTFSPGAMHGLKQTKTGRRMHSAVRLNEMIRSRSTNASLILVNLPGPSKNESSDYNYMQYVETLTEGLARVLFVRGTGKEVITAFAE